MEFKQLLKRNSVYAVSVFPRPRSAFGQEVAGIIEIELPNRVKLRVPAGIGETAPRRVLAVTGQSA
jgi:hypothetical protein